MGVESVWAENLWIVLTDLCLIALIIVAFIIVFVLAFIFFALMAGVLVLIARTIRTELRRWWP